jgi:hypothetical protein
VCGRVLSLGIVKKWKEWVTNYENTGGTRQLLRDTEALRGGRGSVNVPRDYPSQEAGFG